MFQTTNHLFYYQKNFRFTNCMETLKVQVQDKKKTMSGWTPCNHHIKFEEIGRMVYDPRNQTWNLRKVVSSWRTKGLPMPCVGRAILYSFDDSGYVSIKSHLLIGLLCWHRAVQTPSQHKRVKHCREIQRECTVRFWHDVKYKHWPQISDKCVCVCAFT